MKLIRIALIELGEGEQLFSSFRRRLASSREGQFELCDKKFRFPFSEAAGLDLLSVMANFQPALVLLGVPAADAERNAAGFFNLAGRQPRQVPVVAVCQDARPDTVEGLLRLGVVAVWNGAADPTRTIAELLMSSQAASEGSVEIASLRARLGLGQVIGESPAFVAAIKHVPLIGKYQTCVLLAGETGTGKEVFARAIHYHGVRSAKPFIAVNCGAIPVDLLENEFFGHESGAFTSASSARGGLLKEADGGTLFLDEVDCLPPMAQVKLLRFLQDGSFRPLGSERVHFSDVRVIAASNINLAEAVEAGRFRKDLFYRLNVVTLKLPPLRERGGDVGLLARHFLEKFSAKFGAPARDFAAGALLKLACHDWPGNVRELENVIQRAIVVAGPEIITADDIYTSEPAPPGDSHNFRHMKAKVIAQFEQTFVRQLLTAHGGNISHAACAAGKDRRAFWELMRKHHIGAKTSAVRISAP